MKPPTRQRAVPSRFMNLKSETKKRQKTGWLFQNQKNLLYALQQQHGKSDLDFLELQKKMPKCSLFEIENMIKTLKCNLSGRVFAHVRKLRREEQHAKVPIEIWGELAEKMAGVHEETVSSAFSQMLVITATEPSSLLHSDPPRSTNAPSLKDNNIKTLQMRPKSMSQPNSEAPSTPPPVIVLPGRMGKTINESNVQDVDSSPSASTSLITSPHTQHLSTSSNEQEPHVIQPSELSNDSIQPSTPKPSSSQQGKSKPTSPETTSDAAPSDTVSSSSHYNNRAMSSERRPSEKYYQNKSIWMRHVVDFERIYQFLSNKASNPPLSAMECAVLLDLLMALPEELPLLDCTELQQHLLQKYTHLTLSPVVPKAQDTAVTELVSDTLTKTQTPRAEQHAHNNCASSQPLNESTATEISLDDFSRQSSGQIPNRGKDDWAAAGFRPLNPFMLPLALLKRQ